MVNFQDPNVVASETWAVQKFWHALAGLYIWEFVTTLDYEWDIIRRRRPYQWTIWLYSLTRVAILAAVILVTVAQDVQTPYNCQAASTLQLIFAYTAFAAASFLVVLRIIAIWNKNKVISVIAISLWLNNVAFFILCIVRIRAVWLPDISVCSVVNIEGSELTVIASTATDLVLLLIMFVGSLNLRYKGYGTLGLAGLLWKQGVIWLMLAIIMEIPPAVFIILDLNYPLNVIFHPPSAIAMTIAATRMYRSLTDFASDSTDSSIQAAELTQTQGIFHLPYDPEKHAVSKTSYLSSDVGTDNEPHDPPNVPIVNRDLESGLDQRFT